MNKRARRWLSGVAIAFAIASAPLTALAEAGNPSGSDMFVDLVVTRPLGLLALVAGSAAFVVALPFTLPSHSVDQAAEEMVKKPFRYTFKRPLGELSVDQ